MAGNAVTHNKGSVMLIRMTAKDLAAADWDQGTHSARYRKMWPDVKQFVGRNWPTYYPMAKVILTKMLTDKTTSQRLKDEIYEALVEDGLRHSNVRGVKPGRGLLTLRPDQPGRLEQKIFHKD